jgi:hypothetical protein
MVTNMHLLYAVVTVLMIPAVFAAKLLPKSLRGENARPPDQSVR